VLVGICMDRSFEMIVGLLGILKAGGAYVPLDQLIPRASSVDARRHPGISAAYPGAASQLPHSASSLPGHRMGNHSQPGQENLDSRVT